MGQTSSTVSTEAASEGLGDAIFGLNTLKMEIKKADEEIHKHLGNRTYRAHARNRMIMVAMYVRSRDGALEECQKFLERMKTETDLIEEKEGWQNEAESIGRIQRCILETQSVQETVKKMEESWEKFENAWDGLDKAEEEYDKAWTEMVEARQGLGPEEEWGKRWELVITWEGWNQALKELTKALLGCTVPEEDWEKATEEWIKATTELGNARQGSPKPEELVKAWEGWDKATKELVVKAAGGWDKPEEEWIKATKELVKAWEGWDKATKELVNSWEGWAKPEELAKTALEGFAEIAERRGKEFLLIKSVVEGLREECDRMEEERHRIRGKNGR